ncbi:MFS transporter OpS2 [Cladobotryum mycophilum]|uniref:MFS transporter OpS2 n=1 Tax=Cladobotryum mycophilum TaxID=491253 RepID=A0ABR0S4I1_9HYPO
MASPTDAEKALVHQGHQVQPPSDSSSIHSDTTDTQTANGETHDEKQHRDHHKTSEKDVPSTTDIGVEAGAVPQRIQSRASTRPGAVLVPRSERRGMFSNLTLIPEVERPYDYKDSTKWAITFTIAMAAAVAPLGSSIFYPALPAMTQEFHINETTTNLAVAMYIVAMAIFPSGGPPSLSNSAAAPSTSTNIAMLIVFRVCSGGASASVQAVGAGTIADIWESRERGRAMSLFYLGPLMAPLVAPIIGGALAQAYGWKSTMYFLAVYGFVTLLMLLFFLPETFARKPPAPESQPLDRMPTAQSAKVRTKKFVTSLKRIFIDPLRIVLFLRFPPVLITVIVGSIAFGSLYVQSITIQKEFSKPPYNYGQIIVGLLYLPAGLGYVTASFLGGKWIDYIMIREAKKANRYDENGKLILLPEDRMRENMWIANVMYPVGYLIFGWALNYHLIWIVPAIGSFIFGVASMLVFSAATTMLTEFVRKRSSAAVAVNNCIRNLLSCIAVLVTAPWINGVGVGWVFTTVALFCLVAGYLGIWVLWRNAVRWRIEMDKVL